jgi:hypothetical protein
MNFDTYNYTWDYSFSRDANWYNLIACPLNVHWL